jgi:hypothetical protein
MSNNIAHRESEKLEGQKKKLPNSLIEIIGNAKFEKVLKQIATEPTTETTTSQWYQRIFNNNDFQFSITQQDYPLIKQFMNLASYSEAAIYQWVFTVIGHAYQQLFDEQGDLRAEIQKRFAKINANLVPEKDEDKISLVVSLAGNIISSAIDYCDNDSAKLQATTLAMQVFNDLTQKDEHAKAKPCRDVTILSQAEQSFFYFVDNEADSIITRFFVAKKNNTNNQKIATKFLNQLLVYAYQYIFPNHQLNPIYHGKLIANGLWQRWSAQYTANGKPQLDKIQMLAFWFYVENMIVKIKNDDRFGENFKPIISILEQEIATLKKSISSSHKLRRIANKSTFQKLIAKLKKSRKPKRSISQRYPLHSLSTVSLTGWLQTVMADVFKLQKLHSKKNIDENNPNILVNYWNSVNEIVTQKITELKRQKIQTLNLYVTTRESLTQDESIEKQQIDQQYQAQLAATTEKYNEAIKSLTNTLSDTRKTITDIPTLQFWHTQHRRSNNNICGEIYLLLKSLMHNFNPNNAKDIIQILTVTQLLETAIVQRHRQKYLAKKDISHIEIDIQGDAYQALKRKYGGFALTQEQYLALANLGAAFTDLTYNPEYENKKAQITYNDDQLGALSNSITTQISNLIHNSNRTKYFDSQDEKRRIGRDNLPEESINTALHYISSINKKSQATDDNTNSWHEFNLEEFSTTTQVLVPATEPSSRPSTNNLLTPTMLANNIKLLTEQLSKLKENQKENFVANLTEMHQRACTLYGIKLATSELYEKLLSPSEGKTTEFKNESTNQNLQLLSDQVDHELKLLLFRSSTLVLNKPFISLKQLKVFLATTALTGAAGFGLSTGLAHVPMNHLLQLVMQHHPWLLRILGGAGGASLGGITSFFKAKGEIKASSETTIDKAKKELKLTS